MSELHTSSSGTCVILVYPSNAAGDAYRLLSFNKIPKPRRILDSVTFLRDKCGAATLYALMRTPPLRDEVRTYCVVKGERESFVTEEEGSLRRECYVDGWTPINGTSQDFHEFVVSADGTLEELRLRVTRSWCVKASVRDVNSFTSERSALTPLPTLALRLTFNSSSVESTDN